MPPSFCAILGGRSGKSPPSHSRAGSATFLISIAPSVVAMARRPRTCAKPPGGSIAIENAGYPKKLGRSPSSLRLEIQRHAVDAIAQVRRRRAIVEDVAEMAAAAAAVHLGALHAPAAVGGGIDRAWLRIVEARPAGAALEFLLRGEQRLPAADAGERAGAFLVIERATARPFGAVLAHDVELLGREQLLPLRLGVRHGIVLGIRLRAHGSPVRYGGINPKVID